VFLVPEVERSEEPISKKKVKGAYTNWFLPSLWGPIQAAMKQHKNYTSTLHYLQTKYKLLGQIRSVYAGLSRGSLWNWFTTTRELKERVEKKIFNETCSFTKGLQHCYVLSKFPKLEEKIIEMLKAHREAGQPLFATTVRTTIITLIQRRQLSLLQHEGRTTFKVSLAWTRNFIHSTLNWSYKAATGAARNYQVIGKTKI
jgi:hypothetical protein